MTGARRGETVAGSEELAGRFEEHRGHLKAVAYRMLGSLAEAEDAVQEAWLRRWPTPNGWNAWRHPALRCDRNPAVRCRFVC